MEEKEFKKITSDEFKKLLEIENSDNNFVNIELRNYEIDGNIVISDNDKIISIINCKFNGIILSGTNKNIYLYDIECGHISINGNIDHFSLSSSKIGLLGILANAKIDFFNIGGEIENKSSYIGKILFGGGNIIRGGFSNNIIRDLSINGGKIEDLLFEGNNFIEKYTLRGNHNKNSISHNGVIFSELFFDKFVGGMDVSFSNCQNDIKPDFSYGETLLSNKIEAEYIYSNENLIERNRGGGIEIKVLKHEISNKKVIIKNSNLDKTQFHNCNFKNSDIYIENSNLSEIVTTNFILHKNIKSNNIEGERENYRQLKYNFSKQGDSYNALKYYTKEMNILWKISNRKFNISDFLILSFSYISSYYGTKWLITIFWLFLFNLFSYYYFLDLSGMTINFDSKYLLDNLKFSYILSDIKILKIENLSVFSESIFYITKIINSLLLYQLVISFRKFNKQF